MDLPTVGYTGHKSMYKMPTTQINHRKDPFFNINSLRPRLGMDDDGEKTPAEKKDTPLNSSAYRASLGVPESNKSEMRIPVVGYTGHRMGYKA